MTVKTRFAPSPTGYLHVGGARTALYSWLYARHCEGEFILRVEDTDLERSTEESKKAILDGMAWLNLQYDNAHPIYQTERFHRYREVVADLLEAGHAYRCYCSKERLETLREAQMKAKEKPKYDGCCRDLTEEKDASFVVRFRNPTEGAVVFEDKVRGEVSVENAELDDLIIARTDGTPTYNLTVVVDDWDMEITHVIRGDDHLNNTPRQVNILKALGAKPPIYAHVPMILGEDGKRLSKRHGAVSVLEYRDAGFLPEALLNYLVRLGWSQGDQEIFSTDEMIAGFDLTHLNNSPAAFSNDKLIWLNQHYLKTLPIETIEKALLPFMEGQDMRAGPALAEVIALQRERAKTLKEMAEMSRYFYSDDLSFDEKAVKKHMTADAASILTAVTAGLEALATWSSDDIMGAMKAVAEAQEVKLGKVAQPIRIAMTGGVVSPSLGATLALIGREQSLARLKQGLSICQ